MTTFLLKMATFLFRNSKPLARPKGPNTSSCEIEPGAALKSRKIVLNKKLRVVSQKDIQLVGPLNQYLDVDDPWNLTPDPKNEGGPNQIKLARVGVTPPFLFMKLGVWRPSVHCWSIFF